MKKNGGKVLVLRILDYIDLYAATDQLSLSLKSASYNIGAAISFLVNLYMLLPLVVVVVIFAKHKLHATVTTILLVVFWTVMIQLTGLSAGPAVTAATMILVFPLILLSVAPAKAISRRLIFLAIGLLLLIALNELSKLGLDLIAPKFQG